MIYVITMFGLAILLSHIYRKSPLHPLFWMPIFLAIYGSWFYLSLISDGLQVHSQDHLGLKYHLMAIVAFSIPCALIVPRNAFVNISLRSRGFSLDKVVGGIFILMLIFYFVFVLISGASSKREIKDQIIGGLSILSALSLTGIMLMAIRSVACKYLCTKENTISSIIYITVAVLVFLILGERQILFGMLFVWFLVSSTKQKRLSNFGYFYAAVVVGIILISASQGLKAALVGQINWDRVFFESVFNSEFSAPGRNFRYLDSISHGDLVGWQVVITEVQRSFLSVLPGFGAESMSQWFNQTYRHDLGIDGNSGWGFTMVGSAYLAGGSMGVVLYYSFIGISVSLIIRSGRRSDIMLLSYLCIIPILIYSTRQDMSYLVNYYMKFAFMFNMIIYVSSIFCLKNFRRFRRGVEWNDAEH